MCVFMELKWKHASKSRGTTSTTTYWATSWFATYINHQLILMVMFPWILMLICLDHLWFQMMIIQMNLIIHHRMIQCLLRIHLIFHQTTHHPLALILVHNHQIYLHLLHIHLILVLIHLDLHIKVRQFHQHHFHTNLHHLSHHQLLHFHSNLYQLMLLSQL